MKHKIDTLFIDKDDGDVLCKKVLPCAPSISDRICLPCDSGKWYKVVERLWNSPTSVIIEVVLDMSVTARYKCG